MQSWKKLITLAHMIATDEDMLICDLAETYGIYDYGSLPCKRAATLACGLRGEARIKMKLTGMKATPEQMLLASITDRLGLLVWMNSKDGANGRNRPKSLLNELLDFEENDEICVFDSEQEFENEWRKITGK